MLMDQLKEIPRVGKQVVIDNATFTIKKASRRTIDTIDVVVADHNGESA